MINEAAKPEAAKPIFGSGSTGALDALVGYSRGKLPRDVAMRQFGVRDYGSLLQAMNASAIPPPVVPIAERASMVQQMVAHKPTQPTQPTQPTRVAVPDSAVLTALSFAGELDLLLANGGDQPQGQINTPSKTLVLTDIVEFEVMQRSDHLPGARAVKHFIDAHRDRIEVMPTSMGALLIEDIARKRQSGRAVQPGQAAEIPEGFGEMGVLGFATAMRSAHANTQTLVVVHDDWFAANFYRMPQGMILISTAAWLDGLEHRGVLDSAAAVRARIQGAVPADPDRPFGETPEIQQSCA